MGKPGATEWANANDVANLRAELAELKNGAAVSLADAQADLRQVEGPSTITREWQNRRVIVQANVRDRDLGSFVEDARNRLASEVELMREVLLEFGEEMELVELDALTGGEGDGQRPSHAEGQADAEEAEIADAEGDGEEQADGSALKRGRPVFQFDELIAAGIL